MRTKVWDEKQQKWTYIDSDDSASVIDDGRSATDSTYSSKKIDELVKQGATQAELNQAKDELKAEDENIRQSVNEKPDIDDTANNRETALSSRESANRFANAFVGNESGMTIAVNDVSPEKNDVKCRVDRANEIVFPYLEGTHTENGVTWTVNDNQSITASGEATGLSVFVLQYANLEYGNVYRLYTIGSSTNIAWNVHLEKDGKQLWYNGNTIDKPIVIDTVSTGPGRYRITLSFKRRGSGKISGTVFPVFHKGLLETPHFPRLENLTAVKVYQSNKNLLDDRAFLACGFTQTGEHEYYVENASLPWKKVLLSNPSMITGKFTIRFYVKYITENDANRGCFPVVFFTDGSSQELWTKTADSSNAYMMFSFKSPDSKIVDYISFSYGSSTVPTYFKYFEIDYGEPDAIFTPNNTSIFSPDETGLVTGMETKGDTMVILTDTPGTITNIQYNKDPNIVVNRLSERIAALEAKQTNI